MFHFDRKLQQQESDTSSASDSTTDVISRIGVITPTEDEEDAEAREAYESLMRHRKIRRRKKFIKVGIVLGIVVLLAILVILRLSQNNNQAEAPVTSTRSLRVENSLTPYLLQVPLSLFLRRW